jgi:hypothetical protein
MKYNDLGLWKCKKSHVTMNPVNSLLTQKLHAFFRHHTMLKKLIDSVIIYYPGAYINADKMSCNLIKAKARHKWASKLGY